MMLAGGFCDCFGEEVIADSSVKSEEEKKNGEVELRLYKGALLQGPSDQSRDDSVVVLLKRSDPECRVILVEALALKDNAAARKAVCRGLINSREWSGSLVGADDFFEPLMTMISEASGDEAKLAAEALLMYPYYQVRYRIGNLAHGEGVAKNARLNAIYYLSLVPGEKSAILELVDVLSDKDKDVAAAAGEALPYWVPKGADRAEVVRELQMKSPSEIIRDRMDYQRKEMRRLEDSMKMWRDLYVKSLDFEYDASVDADRGAILYSKLESTPAEVKVWALQRVIQRSASVVLPEGFGERLIGLLSDPDSNVRLETSKVLKKMSDELNFAVKLLESIKVEKNSVVRLGMFEALGEACNFAFSPNSTIKLPDSVRLEALREAGEYVKNGDTVSAGVGAEAIRKLLEPNNLSGEVKGKYLLVVSERYAKEKGSGSVLEGKLLGSMAKMCNQNREKAGKLFKQYFIDGLDVKNSEAVREASVAGLGNLDKGMAIGEFRSRKLYSDGSVKIRMAVISVAKDAGKAEDLEWLVKNRTASNGEGPLVWEAIRAILQRQKAAVIVEWAEKVRAAGGSDEQVEGLLDTAVKKAEGENNVEVLKLAKEKLRLQQIDGYIKAGEFEKVAEVFSVRLVEGDVGKGDRLAVRVDIYLGSEAVVEAKKKFVGLLAGVKPAGVKAQWAGLVKGWQEKVTPKPVVKPEPKVDIKPAVVDSKVEAAKPVAGTATK